MRLHTTLDSGAPAGTHSNTRRSRTTGPATDVATTTAHQSPISGGQGLCVWVQSRRTSHHTLTDIMVPAIVIEPVVANLAPEPK